MLGAVELSPFDVAQLYQYFAADGHAVPLRSVRGVIDGNGRTLSRFGVKPGTGDYVAASRLVTWAARSYFDRLLAAGVKIHEYGPRMLHTKALLVDDEIAMIGSANFDARSFRLNFEVAMLIRNQEVAAELAKLIEAELESAPCVRDDRIRPLWRVRLPEAMARLMSPLL